MPSEVQFFDARAYFKSNESEHACRPKRQTTGTQPSVCIFVRLKHLKCYTRLLLSTWISLLKSKYHLTCLTKFRNSYRAFQRAQQDSSSLSNSMPAKA